jgi:hypothetical protein
MVLPDSGELLVRLCQWDGEWRVYGEPPARACPIEADPDYARPMPHDESAASATVVPPRPHSMSCRRSSLRSFPSACSCSCRIRSRESEYCSPISRNVIGAS